MGKGIIISLILILLVGIVDATTVSDNEITITSDKDTYYCQPVFQDDACLIVAKISVTNERTSAINLDGLSTFTNFVADIEYLSSEGSRIPQQAQAMIPQELFLGGEKKTYELRFFTEESGKFDYTVNLYQLGTGNLLATTVLDPFYNISVNATSPSYFLEYGITMNESVDEFENKIDITVGLSDGNASTSYLTSFATLPSLSAYFVNGWAFNEYIFGSTLYSFSGDLVGEISGQLDTIPFGDYYGGYFDGVNDYVRFRSGADKDVPDLADFSVCMSFNTTMETTSDKGIITKGTTADGVFMTYKLDETIDCEFDGDTGAVTVSTPVINDNENHIICCVKTGDSVSMWLDGAEVDIASANIGAIQNSNDMFFGSEDLGLNKWEGSIRQVGFFNTSINSSILVQMNETKTIGDFNKGQAIHAYYNYSITKDAITKNYLAVFSNVSELTTIRVLSYENMTHPNSTNYVTDRITTGISYVSIDDIVNTGYNLPFRFFNIEGRRDAFISEIYLVFSTNDTQPPSISNCQVNTTSLGCDETVRLQCDITDDGDIYQAWFSTNNTATTTVATERANKLNGVYYLDKTMTGSYNQSKDLVWFLANATDLGDNFNETALDIHVNYSCSICTEDWVADSISCLINDTYLKTYTDQNSCGTYIDLPVDNGTYISCNYCTEDLEKNYLTECTHNGSYYVIDYEWEDQNYFSCCVFSGLVSDCSVDYSPYNETSYSEFCTFLEDDFSVDYDENVYFALLGNKVYWKFNINDTNNSYKCQSYVKTTSGNLIQTNPIYTKKSDTLISLRSTEYEDREYFETYNGLGQAYFTEEYLVKDGRAYVFGVECSGNGQTLTSERLVHTFHEQIKDPITRFVWLKENIFGIVTLIVILVILGLALFALLRVVRR